MTDTTELVVDVESRAEIDGTCDYHECAHDSRHLWHGVSADSDSYSAQVFLAEYCDGHSQSHAEIEDGVVHIGFIEEVRP